MAQLSLFDLEGEGGGPRGELVVAHGPRAVEEELLARTRALADAARREPALLGRPARVVVPSRGLKDHVAARLVRRTGGALLGVIVQTLHGLACEVLERAGAEVPQGGVASGVLAARLARLEPTLRRGLDDLDDGYAMVAGTVRDLLDAGLEPAHADAAEEALASAGRAAATPREIARARALVRVAAGTEVAMAALGLGRSATLWRRARELVLGDPQGALPARAVLIHGFADATGLAIDLLDALLRTHGACLLIDLPPQPLPPPRRGEALPTVGVAAGSESAPATVSGFAGRLAARLAGAVARERGWGRMEPARSKEAPPGVSEIRLLSCAGAEGEMREIARRLRGLLDGGARAEGIAVVARDFSPYRVALGRHLRRFGVPFTAAGERGGLTPGGRRARAVLELLRQGDQIAFDRLLDAAWLEGAPFSGTDPAPPAGIDPPPSQGLDPAPPNGLDPSPPNGLDPAHPPLDPALPAALHPELAPGIRRVRRSGLERVLPGEGAGAPRSGPAPASGSGQAGRSGLVDLRLAFHAMGALRLRDVAELSPWRFAGGYSLPIRLGLRARGGEERVAAAAGSEDVPGADFEDAGADVGADAGGSRSARRVVPAARLARAVELAVAVRARLSAWPREAPAGRRLLELRGLLADLGWKPAAGGDAGDLGGGGSEASQDPLETAIGELERELPLELPLTVAEVRQLLEQAIGESATSRLGGRGGGVQVLSVTEARGLTFEHLFVAGLNRNLFPRMVREDPLLSDALRRVLGQVLPDVPVKSVGYEEERHLFAQLLSAAPEVILSWRETDDDGLSLAPSPLLAPLLAGMEVVRVPPALAASPLPAAWGDRLEANWVELPPEELVLAAALFAPRERFEGVLAVTLEEARAEVLPAGSGISCKELAASRVRVLEEQDPSPPLAVAGAPSGLPGPGGAFGPAGLSDPSGELRAAAGARGVSDAVSDASGSSGTSGWGGPRGAAARPPGPYFGFIGDISRTAGADPRRNPVYLTSLEQMARCPWQLFLVRLLGIQATPDPVATLPGIDPLLLGTLVHAVLHRLVSSGPAGRPRPDRPALVAWPPPAELERLLQEEAARLLAEEGPDRPGLALALARRAEPFLAAARELDWDEGTGVVEVLGSELNATIELGAGPGHGRTLHFRADRLDRKAAGTWRWTDYKTGRPISAGRRAPAAATLRKDLLARVRRGTHLQVVGYLRARVAGPPPVARYLFLAPGAAAQREVVAEAGDEELAAAFTGAAGTALAAWDAGTFFPRLSDPAGRREPAACSFCEVAEACLRGDAGARRRLVGWVLGPPAPRWEPLGETATAAEGEADRPAPREQPETAAHPAPAAGPGPAAEALIALWHLAEEA